MLGARTQQALDRLTRLAARLLHVPMALVSLVDADLRVFASGAGLAAPCARETPLWDACCHACGQLVVASASPLILEDVREHPTLGLTLTSPALGGVAYAGMPLLTAQGQALGSFCVVDGEPRRWSADDLETLEELARSATAEIELHLATRRLAERTADLTDLVDGSAELVCATDADGRLTFVNRAWRETLGYADAELAALRPTDLVAPEHRARYVETARRLIAGERVDDFEAVLLARDGRRVVCRGRGVPILQPGPDGLRCVGTRAYYRDVTPEHAADARRTRLVGMLEATADFVGTVAPDGRVEFLNAAGRRMAGLAVDADVQTLEATRFHPPATLERLAADALPTATREGRWAGEGALLGPGGEEIPVSMVVVAQPSLVPGEPPYFAAVMRDLRDRVRAEAALRASEAEYRSLLAALPLIVYRVEPHAPYAPLYVSPGVAALGYTLEEWLAAPDTWLRVLHPDDRARVLAETERALTSDGAVDYEYRVITKDGTVRWIHDRGQFVRDAAAAPVAWQGIMVDVTAQRAAEDALRTSEARFRAIFDGAGVGVTVLDDAGTLLQVNEAFADYLGYDVEALVGRHAPALSPADDADVTRAPVAELRAGRRTSVTVEKRFLHRDGQPRWAKLTLSRLPLGDGRSGILGITTDITERRRVQAALERERAFLAATLESLSDGVVACDAEGRIALFNRATREFHGLPEAALPPERWADHYRLLQPDGETPLPADEVPLWRAFQGEELRAVGMVIAPTGAPRRHVRVSGRPIRDGAGDMLGAVVAMHDVTAQDAAERALRDSEARYRGVVELSPDAILVHVGGVVRYANRRAATLLRAETPEALVGVRVAELVPADERAALAERAHRIASGGAPAELRDQRIIRQDGSVVHCEVTAGPAPYDGGRGVQVVLRDVTARRRAVAALKTSEARFRAALDGGRFGFAVLAPLRDAHDAVTDFTVLAVNGQSAALIDMPEEDLVGQRYGDLLPLARDAGHLAVFAQVLATGVPHEADVRVTDPRFGAEWVRLQAVPLHDEDGDGLPDGVALLVRDITAEKRAAREARLLMEVTHALVAAPDLHAAAEAALAAMCGASGWEYGEAWLVEPTTASGAAAPDGEPTGTYGPGGGARLVHGPVWHRPGDSRLAGFAAASRGFTLACGDGLPGAAWRRAAPVVFARLHGAAEGGENVYCRAHQARRAGLRSGVAVPVLAGDTVVAVLTFHTRDPRRVAQTPVALLSAVAAQVGAAVQRKLAEAALAEQSARLALIYNSATDLMFLMRLERDASGAVAAYRCESVNDAYLAVTRLAREQLLERTVDEILPPDAAAQALRRYAEAVRAGEVQRYDETVDLSTGRIIVETTLTPVLDDARRCTHLLGVARDVSATRRAEAAVRASEARFRGVLEHLRAPAVQIDLTGHVTFVNEALLMLTGWTRAEALGADWFAHFVPNGPIARVLFEESVRTGVVPIQHEGELLTRHGAPRTVAWDHVALRGADGALCGIASVGQDITERRALEARLAALSEHDELTGLLNRRGFNRMAEHAIRSAGRSQRHDAVLYVDLDRFKPINDTYGHAAGDEALRCVAQVIRATVRDADFGGRLGGDEFAIFAVGLREGEGHVLAARLRANLEAHNAEAAAAGRPFRIAFSVGVAEVEPGDNLASLLVRGDAALYAQKLARAAGATTTGR